MIQPIQRIPSQDAIKTSIRNNQYINKKGNKIMNDIMSLSSGTKLKCKNNGYIYYLGDFVDSNNRKLISDTGLAIDFINYDNQNSYEAIY